MTTPTTAEYFEAASAAYNTTPSATGDLTLLQGINGSPVSGTRPKDGFHGTAYETAEGQVIVAYEGTDLGGLQQRPTFVQAQINADKQIYEGQNPALYDDAYRFTVRAINAAVAQGISPDNVFVDGHSLGAAQAEYVAANTGLAGATFGAPGIPGADIAPGEASALTNYVDFGDPVGNYSSNPAILGDFIGGTDIQHFCTPTYLGSQSDVQQLGIAGKLYGQTGAGTAAAFGILGNALLNHHLLEDYAADLGLPSSGSGSGGIDAGTLTQIIGMITGQGSGGGLPFAAGTAAIEHADPAAASSHELTAALHPHGHALHA